MKRVKYVSLLVFLSVILSADLSAADSERPPENMRKVSIPSHAIEVAPGLFHLGTAIDKGRPVEGYAMLMKSKVKFARSECGNGICEPGENARKCPIDCGDTPTPDPDPDTSSCYDYTSGVKWKQVEPYLVNPANDRGLDDIQVADALEFAIGDWEDAADVQGIIIGEGSATSEVLEADFYATDGKNEVYFGDIDSLGAIGVTVVWGIFRGPPAWRELVEWDQVYNQAQFDWSIDCILENDCTEKMDFPSIAIHELGHSVGLNDLYTDECSAQTMFGYAVYGETDKRTLEDGDIRGIQELYSD